MLLLDQVCPPSVVIKTASPPTAQPLIALIKNIEFIIDEYPMLLKLQFSPPLVVFRTFPNSPAIQQVSLLRMWIDFRLTNVPPS